MKKSWDFWVVRLYTYKFTQYTTTHSISPWKEKAIQMRCMWDNHSFSQKAEIQLLQSKVLFFSLDQPVTKNQILNTNFLPKFLVFISMQKKKKKGLAYSLFELKQQQKKGWHLMFSIWFLSYIILNKECNRFFWKMNAFFYNKVKPHGNPSHSLPVSSQQKIKCATQQAKLLTHQITTRQFVM